MELNNVSFNCHSLYQENILLMEIFVKSNQDFGEINVTTLSQVSDHHARGLWSGEMKTKQNYYEVLGEEIVII